MKKSILLLALLMTTAGAFSQNKDKRSTTISTGLVLFSDIWRHDIKGLETWPVNPGADFYVTANIPIENTPLYFSLGMGLGSHNLYSNSVLIRDTATGIYGFTPVGDLPGDINYKKTKVAVTYWDFPMEFRFQNKGGITAALGMKFGLVVSSTFKYKGEDYLTPWPSRSIKFKEKSLENLTRWRYGMTARLGYKMLELYYFYSFTSLFEEDMGPDVAPMSIGISVRPLIRDNRSE